MYLIDAATAEAYLGQAGRVAAGERIEVREMSGGVSNVVLYVRRPDVSGGDFVLKQARPQLRVQQPWFCSVERIWREAEVLRICQGVLASQAAKGNAGDLEAVTPGVLWEDRENYAFAMTAAPPHRVWKQDLLAGCSDSRIAEACGRLLGRLHAGTWHAADLAAQLADQTFFVDLRVDPYYRRIAEVHPDLQAPIGRLVDAVCGVRLSLVHGDFSPKNLLVYDGGLMLVDSEVGHFGDPAFDLGFYLSHLSLKAILKSPEHEPYLALIRSFWSAYEQATAWVVGPGEQAALTERAIGNLAGCLLARVDGKSPVEYLDDSRRQDAARRLAYILFRDGLRTWGQVEELLSRECRLLANV